MKSICIIVGSLFLMQATAQIDSLHIPCSDLRTMLGDALNHHKDDKGVQTEHNEYTGITEFAYHVQLAWAQKVSIREMEFEDGKVKSWGEVLVYKTHDKEVAIAYANMVKAELKACFNTGVDHTDKAQTEGRDFSFVFMVHNDFSWTDIELFVSHTGEDYHVYIIF